MSALEIVGVILFWLVGVTAMNCWVLWKVLGHIEWIYDFLEKNELTKLKKSTKAQA